MKITMEILSSSIKSRKTGIVCKEDIQKNINTLNDIIFNVFKSQISLVQTQSLIDTKSILEGIQDQLPAEGYL